jgi:hypothetical protein
MPVMSLVAVLVPLLAMGAEFAHLAVVETTLPAMCGCGHRDPDPSLNLTLFVHDWGVEVAGEDPELEGRRSFQCEDGHCDGDIDTSRLSALLAEVKARHPHDGRVIVVADRDVPYGHLVRVMDAARSFEGQDLFHWPVLAGGAS